MAEGDLQRRVDRLEEVTIVQASIMDRLERKYDEAIRRHDEAIKKHDEEMAELRAAQRKTEESLQVMSSGIRALTETVDQFIKGSKSNGLRPGGKKR